MLIFKSSFFYYNNEFEIKSLNLMVFKITKSEENSQNIRQSRKTYKKSSDISDLLKNQVRFNIYSMLEVFGELSLTKLAYKLHKSKSTIHEHLKRLLETGLISTPIKKPSLSKSNVFENYYKLSENYRNVLSHIDDQLDLLTPMTKRKAKHILQMGKSMTKFFISSLEKKLSFYHEMEASIEKNPDQIIEIISEMNSFETDNDGDIQKNSKGENIFHSENFNSFNYYNNSQLDYMRERLFSFYTELENNKRFIELGRKEKDRGSLVITTVIPLKRIFDFNNSPKN